MSTRLPALLLVCVACAALPAQASATEYHSIKQAMIEVIDVKPHFTRRPIRSTRRAGCSPSGTA